MLESYQQTDNGDLDSEKTAVIEELLMEVERLDKGCGIRNGMKIQVRPVEGGEKWVMT